MRTPAIVLPFLLVAASLCASSSSAQSGVLPAAVLYADAVPAPASTPAAVPAAHKPRATAERTGILSRMGVGLRLSSLGPGADFGFALARRINIRGGFNYFSYSQNFTNSGVHYTGSLKFQSGEAHVDYFLWKSIHVSPGLLFSGSDLVSGKLAVPGGQTFTLSNTDYTSNPANPIAGNGALKFNNVAPSILFGIGDVVPRGNRRFSILFEVGGAFRGTPTVKLNFTGSACDANGLNCQNITSDPSFQTNVAAQQTKFNNDISFLKFFPIISGGISFRL